MVGADHSRPVWAEPWDGRNIILPTPPSLNIHVCALHVHTLILKSSSCKFQNDFLHESLHAELWLLTGAFETTKYGLISVRNVSYFSVKH